MSTAFDFGQLVAGALANHPDAELLEMLGRARVIRDEMDVARRRGERAYRKALKLHCQDSWELSDRIARTPARSREAMIEKARYALGEHRTPGTIEDTFGGLHGSAFSALHDFLTAEGWA